MVALTLSLLGIFLTIQTIGSIKNLPKVLLISFDGFRYDLLDESTVPTIFQWAENSSWFINGVQSQYLTYTAPNHLSMVTGLFEESHGVTGNRFLLQDGHTFDYYGKQKADAIERLKTTKMLKGDPIWITNERADSRRKSFVLKWPFAEAFFEKEPHKPKFHEMWLEYGSLDSFKLDVDRIVETLSDSGDPSNFVAWYVDQPDTILHKYGFHTGHLTEVLSELDNLFGYLLGRLEKAGLLPNVNIILTADHGHAEVSSYKNVLCIRDHVQGDFSYGDLALYPKTEEQSEAIYRHLTEAIAARGLKIKVHRKKGLPERYHYKNSERTGGILLEPSIGYAVSFHCTEKRQEELFSPTGTAKFHSSVHGQAPENREMRALLVMNGPDIQNNLKITEVPQNVDLYSLLCRLLEIVPSPNNGSWSLIDAVLKRPSLFYM